MKALVDKYTKEELEQFVKESTTMNQVLEKLGYDIRGRNQEVVKTRLNEYGIDYSHFTLSGVTQNKRTYDNVFCEGSTASQHTLRNWYQKYVPMEKCSICGQLPFWNNAPLTLILDHINGTHNDNRIENLRWACPNCNQQLPTTGYQKMRTEDKEHKKYLCSKCGKPINKQSTLCIECFALERRTVERPNREEFKHMIRTMSFEAIGRQYGVDGKTIPKWCDSYKLPRRKLDIKIYTDEEWEKL